MPALIVKPLQEQIDDINQYLIQLELDMKAIAEAIKKNNETTVAILNEIERSKDIPILKIKGT